MAQRRLNAIAVEDFAFDLRGLHCLFADELNPQGFLVIRSYVADSSDKLPGLTEELLFQGLKVLES